MMKLFSVILWSTVCCNLLILPAAHANTLYRYTNDSGALVMSDVIPPYYATKGYDIIDSRGDVIKTIPKELSPEEKKQQRQIREKQAKMDAWDYELRSRYRNLDNIEKAKARRLKGIDNSITSLQLTLDNISETVKYYQAEAASNERQGQLVPEDTLSSMARLQKDRDFIVKEIEKRQKSREQIAKEFDKDIARFKVILAK